MREISLPADGTDALDKIPGGLLARSGLIIGIVFYLAGTISFIAITVAFFMFRMYELSSNSRVAFVVLFAGMFCAFQGLIFILAVRGGEVRRSQNNYLLNQIRILYSHSSPGTPPPPGRN